MRKHMISVLFTIVLLLFSATAVYAADADNKTVAGLGTSAISNPTGLGQWNYVYYGKYNGSPVKYRVLDKASTEFGGNTMLLDCDSQLFIAVFDSKDLTNIWKNSSLCSGLNGDRFLDKAGVFTTAERAAIASSIKTERSGDDGSGYWNTERNYGLMHGPLTGQQIFVLDAFEVTRESYGYRDLGPDENGSRAESTREKSGAHSTWWLRSTYSELSEYAGLIINTGKIGSMNVRYSAGVSPAFNVNLSSVLFSSAISSGEYKLTLIDENMAFEEVNLARDGKEILVDYSLSKGSPNRISILMTDKDWSESGAKIKYYGALSNSKTFELPSGYEKNWKVYIIAEQVNGEKETDYASTPQEIVIPEEKFIEHTVSNVKVKYDGKEHGIEVKVTNPASGAVVKYGMTQNSCTQDKSPTYTDVTTSAVQVFYQIKAKNYTTVIGSATIEITKADQDAPKAPSADTVTSTSIKLTAIENGEYKCGNGSWQSSPEFTGLTEDTEYTFYQRVKEDGNHNASEESSAKIRTAKKYTVSYSVTGDAPSGAPSAPTDTNKYEEGENVTVKAALSFTGYTFSGWRADGVSISGGSFPMPGNDVTLKGSWKVNSHTLTVRYQYSDGKEAAKTHTETVDYGAEYSVTSPEIEGYTASQETVKGKMEDKDVTVKVTYDIDTHKLTITYQYKDGSKAANAHKENLEYGADYSVASPKITGYTADKKTVKGKMPDQDVSVTVVYSAREYTITFNTNGGSEVAPITQAFGTKVNIPADPKKDGYIFAGWQTAIPKTMPAKNMTIKASWKKDTTPDPVDPNKRNYYLFQIQQSKVANSRITFTWTKVPGATSYAVYGSPCSETFSVKKLDVVKKTSFTQRKLEKGTYYRYYVVALNGKKKIATSDVIHIATTGGSYGSPVSVKVPNKTITLKVRRTRKLNATVKNDGLVAVHKTSEIMYESTNPKIAKVSKDGKVTAVAEGTCYVYAFAQNGINRKVKIVVK